MAALNHQEGDEAAAAQLDISALLLSSMCQQSAAVDESKLEMIFHSLIKKLNVSGAALNSSAVCVA